MPIERTVDREGRWRDLEQGALHALEAAFEIEPAIDVPPVLRLWERPSIKDPVRSWTVGLARDAAEAKLRRITWLRSADAKQTFDSLDSLRKGMPPGPRLEVVDAPVSVQRLRSFLAKARRLRFSALGASGPWGLDGHSSGVWFRAGFNEVRFEWWADGPDAWASLRSWHHEVERWLNECARRAARRGSIVLYPEAEFIRSVRREAAAGR